MRGRLAFVLLSLAVAAVPRAHGQCALNQVEMAYTVCTQWWDGTTSCHWQLGWFDVYSCSTDVNGGGGPGGGDPGGGGPGGGDGPTPPTLEIRDISDANPLQPVLRIVENDAVVETTLAYNGHVALTTGKTEALFLNALNSIDGETVITVQARNAANQYAIALFTITRDFHAFRGTTVVWAVWTKIRADEPEQVFSEWNRTVDVAATRTSYDIPTVGDRNGQWEHNYVEDQIAATSAATPNPAWETKYTIDNLQQLNYYYGTNCSVWPISYTPYTFSTICTDVNAFSRASSPTGTATILDFDIGPLTGTWLAAGQVVPVWVY